MGLPGPQDVSGCVVVAVQYQSTGGADRGAHAEALLHALATPTAILAGRGGFHQQYLLTGACCLVLKCGTELRPARVRDGLGEMGLRTRLATRKSSRETTSYCVPA